VCARERESEVVYGIGRGGEGGGGEGTGVPAPTLFYSKLNSSLQYSIHLLTGKMTPE